MEPRSPFPPTHHPFADGIEFTVTTPHAVSFPLDFRVPAWATEATATVGGQKVAASPGQYLRLEKKLGER